jgi:hypothetical protein
MHSFLIVTPSSEVIYTPFITAVQVYLSTSYKEVEFTYPEIDCGIERPDEIHL